MNPSELRMMWMSQYNPERITLEDAASYFGHSSVGLSVMDDMTHQTTMDFNPMMSIVGGDFSGQAAAAAAAVASSAAAAAALSVQPTALITAHSNDIYGLAQVSGLHQQLLQQSTAGATFQNYAEIIADEDGGGGGCVSKQGESLDDDGTQYVSESHPQVYENIDTGSNCYDDDGISGLTAKQEIINIDDFVMMNDSNSYDGTELMPTADSDLSSGMQISQQGIDDNSLFITSSNQKLCASGGLLSSRGLAEATSATTSSAGNRTQRKTRKIEPVSRPGLVLKTPIAYKGNIDPSVIPIQKDGMAVCERCGAIGVKHTFYTKSRRFCSMSCARGELFSLVVNNKMTGGGHQQQQHTQQQQHGETSSCTAGAGATSEAGNEELHENSSNANDQHQPEQQSQTDIEIALRVSHIKNSNYRFRITDQSKITQINGYGGESILEISTKFLEDGNGKSSAAAAAVKVPSSAAAADLLDGSHLIPATNPPQPLEMYRDVMPQDELPQIPKFERLPTPCPQMEKIFSVRRRILDPSHSYDWTARLSRENFYAAPVTCFLHAPGYEVWDNIGINMKVEVENTDCDNTEVIQPGQTPHSFWVATILNICGYKALMRYEGFDDASHDFWVNLCNAEVHSVGWCAARGKPLIPPRSIEHKYKDWKDFLVERLSGARTLPSSFYNKIHDSMQSRFRLGLNLECVDKDRISQVRLATVTKIVGKRLFLRYFDSDDGFWCHEDSPIIHPVGWATTVGHNLAAPQDYLERMLAGREAMIEVHEDDATIELFKMNFTFEEYYLERKTNSFVEGMKIEAVDPLNLSSICVATVMAVLKFGYMMIRIDSYQPDSSGSDWFCYHEKSPSIFPVGFCAANNIALTPPNGYDVTTFSWESYLKETGSIAADVHLFQRILPDHGFEVGMSLECADLMDPRLVCVATISRVVGRLLKIHFDGWTDEYDQWLDCESPDFYPVGWCVLVNHKLEGPPVQLPTISKVSSRVKPQKKRKKKTATNRSNENFSGNKSRTIALKTGPHLPKLSIKLELKPEHHKAAFYEDNDNDDDDEECDDESLSRSGQSTPLPIVTKATGHLPESSQQQQQLQQQPPQQRGSATVKTLVTPPAPITGGRRACSYRRNSTVSSGKYIPRLTEVPDSNTGSANTDLPAAVDLVPETWNIYDVSQFLRVNDCIAHCDTFSRNKIDGKRLLQLSKDEIITLLGMKVGPALKIYDLIQQLKCKINPSKSRYHKANKTFL